MNLFVEQTYSEVLPIDQEVSSCRIHDGEPHQEPCHVRPDVEAPQAVQSQGRSQERAYGAEQQHEARDEHRQPAIFLLSTARCRCRSIRLVASPTTRSR